MAAPSSTVSLKKSAPRVKSGRFLGVIVSAFVIEVASGSQTPSREIPDAKVLCKTILSIEQQVLTAQTNQKELAGMLRLIDLATRSVMNSCDEVSYGALTKLKKCVWKAKDLAAMCNRGRIRRMMLGRNISGNIAAVESDLVSLTTYCSYFTRGMGLAQPSFIRTDAALTGALEIVP